MKTLKVIFLIVFSSISISTIAQSKIQKDTVTVYGICSMCKKKIEKAAKEAGASSAIWNQETKVLKVSYNGPSTNNLKIQEGIAAVGYDTRDVKATETSYNSLDECCRNPRTPKNP